MLVGAAAALAMPADSLVGVFYDDGIYLTLARSLAEGHGYRLAYLPGAPAGVHYPVGYPLFLAGLWSLWPDFPANVGVLRGANAVLLGGFAGAATAYLAPRLELKPWALALAVLLAATSVPLIAVTTVLFSEPLFLLLVVLACWAADASGTREGSRGWWLGAAAGLLAGLATLTRSIGVAVAVGVVLALVRRHRAPRAALAAVVAAAVVLPWFAWSAAHRGEVDPVLASNYGTYGDFMAQGGVGWLRPATLLAFLRPLAAIALPPMPGWLLPFAAVAPLVVLAAGFLPLLRGAAAAGWMLLAYLGIVAVWPYGPDRFVWAAVPWLACAFAAGLILLWRGEGPRRSLARGVVLVAALLVTAGTVPAQVRGWREGSATATQRGISATFAPILPWIREQTDSSAVIATEDEALVWLYTGRRAVPSYLWQVRGRSAESYGADTLRAWFERAGVTHLVLTGPGSDAAPSINDLLGAYPGYLRVVRSWPGPMLAFALTRAAAATTAGTAP